MRHTSAIADLAGLRHEHLLYFARRSYEQLHGVQPRRYGVSSDAMVEFALGLGPEPTDLPSDLWDLDACERAYETAPADLQALMLPVLRRYREHIHGLDRAMTRPCEARKYGFSRNTSPVCELPEGHSGLHKTGEVTW